MNSIKIQERMKSLEEVTFSCQSTCQKKATLPLRFWDIRQYIWDITSGAFRPTERISLLLVTLNLKIRRLISDKRRIPIHELRKITPTVTLNLQPGELVDVRSKDEILSTIDNMGKNRGLVFNAEMLKYCGKRYRVWRRLDKMINEKTGKMRQISNTVILDGVTCDGKAHGGCSRTCYCFWREIWLKRVE